MKPRLDSFCVVTATTSPARAADCVRSWTARARYQWPLIVVANGTVIYTESTERFETIPVGSEYAGVVPSFARGVEEVLHPRWIGSLPAVIACLHDDLLIEEDGWDETVLRHFHTHPGCGLAGFGGGRGLADSDLYQKPYSPHSLARTEFVSNLRDAEAHGLRRTMAERISVLDGFSLIGRRAYWRGRRRDAQSWSVIQRTGNLFAELTDWGLVHHAYDAALGAFAKRLGWEVWMLPIACHHFGGQTAVADQGYHAWAESVVPGGDRSFWELAHKEVYQRFTDVLPIRIGGL